MRNWLSCLTIALLAALAADPAAAEPAPCDGAPGKVLVRVHDVRSGDGNITALLYGDNPRDFLKKGKKLVKIRAPAHEGTVEVCLPAPGPGEYAVTVYHDENGNTDFDRSWLGIPTEGYGFSNDPVVFFGPPDYADAAFRLEDGETTVDVTLTY